MRAIITFALVEGGLCLNLVLSVAAETAVDSLLEVAELVALHLHEGNAWTVELSGGEEERLLGRASECL
jgi:hypothetical protein